MTTIIGVDFSGAKTDRNTWMTMGRLGCDGSLWIDTAQRIQRADLYRALLDVATPAVAALDFPFGVPATFAAALAPDLLPSDMRAAWDAVSRMTAAEFVTARDNFVAGHGEPKRAGDLRHHPESYSPLHTVNPNMLPMTWHGMNLMRRWHQESPARWHVPPLPQTGLDGETVTLLELMPGAFLRSVGLPYKGYKRGRDAQSLRRRILRGLPGAAHIMLANLETLGEDCLANDDCLDSVVAAVGAAIWVQDPNRFHHPSEEETPEAKLEGWIYVPRIDPN